MTTAAALKKPGPGQAYLGAYRDKDGHPFDGAKAYRLRVPPNPPAQQFLVGHPLRDGYPTAHPEPGTDCGPLLANGPPEECHGSVDIYMSPKAEGLREELDSDRVRQSLVRVFPPLRARQKPTSTKAGRLPDIELVK